MHHIEMKQLKYNASIPPRVPVHDFQAGREPSGSEWQPARYPFENETGFVDIDDEEVAPEPREPERKGPEADKTAEVLAKTELDEEKESAQVVTYDCFDSSQLSIHAGNWCVKGAGMYQLGTTTCSDN